VAKLPLLIEDKNLLRPMLKNRTFQIEAGFISQLESFSQLP
jgi:hypothetical protein